MSEERLNIMAILYIESDLLKILDCDEIVNKLEKSKKKLFKYYLICNINFK